jgi:hypothetical protein
MLQKVLALIVARIFSRMSRVSVIQRWQPLPKNSSKQGMAFGSCAVHCKHYWIEEEKPVLSLEERFAPKNLERKFAWPEYPAPIQVGTKAASPIEIEPIPELEKQLLYPAVIPVVKEEKAKTSAKKLNYKEPLPLSSDEWLAQKLYKATGNLQMIEARQMLHLYGKELVGKVLGRMEYLKQRGNIENPAGLLKDALRVAWRAKYGFTEKVPEYSHSKRR